MVEKILFIEGTTNDSNGNLRQGFACLLENEIKGSMIRIKMGNDKRATINKFQNSKAENSFLLVDLDKEESFRNNDINEYKLEGKQDSVFYMIQEMEAWFLSQPEILDDFFGVKVPKKIRSKDPKKIENPDKILQGITQLSIKGKYHKVKHGVNLLKRLDSEKLYEDFSDFKNLVDKIRIEC
jgi:hypothetical protein